MGEFNDKQLYKNQKFFACVNSFREYNCRGGDGCQL